MGKCNIKEIAGAGAGSARSKKLAAAQRPYTYVMKPGNQPYASDDCTQGMKDAE